MIETPVLPSTAQDTNLMTVAQAAAFLGISDRYIKMLSVKHSWAKTYSNINNRTVTLYKKSDLILFKEFRSITKNNPASTTAKEQAPTIHSQPAQSSLKWKLVASASLILSLIFGLSCLFLFNQLKVSNKKLELKQQRHLVSGTTNLKTSKKSQK